MQNGALVFDGVAISDTSATARRPRTRSPVGSRLRAGAARPDRWRVQQTGGAISVMDGAVTFRGNSTITRTQAGVRPARRTHARYHARTHAITRTLCGRMRKRKRTCAHTCIAGAAVEVARAGLLVLALLLALSFSSNDCIQKHSSHHARKIAPTHARIYARKCAYEHEHADSRSWRPCE